ncbi:MAG TPA: cytochrome d ubiquinol oxidase subunit II [Candidatus Tectomicrobia bacterium]|nr:cytochrome d ubiquinol oxidase subunit II [Candidatus Tectomicrobia bacterium]
METLLAFVILAATVLYALSGGADFGGGMWDLLARGPRARQQREAIDHAIAPIWEANHVWLVLVVVVVFTAFPPAFAALMTALHIPVTAVLLGIVVRGAAFAFRKYDVPDDRVHRRWSTAFGIASLVTPFLLGLCLGALASGDIRVTGGVVATGFFAGWTGPFAVACGLFAQALFAFLAAVYLCVDVAEDRALQEDFRRRALASGLALAPIALAVFLIARAEAPVIFAGLTRWWAPLLLGATSVCAVAALLALAARRFRLARAMAVGQVALVIVGWGLAQYPYLVVPDLTFAGTAAPRRTLRMLIVALAAGLVVLLPSFVYLYRVFKGAQRAERGGEPLRRPGGGGW